MRTLPLLMRVVALNLLVVQAIPFAFAESSANITIDASSTSDTTVEQDADDGSDQKAVVDGYADITVNSTQSIDTHERVNIDQDCASNSGSGLCFSDASPKVVTSGEQNITVNAENTMKVDQDGGTGSTQLADVLGTAYADVNANQTVTSDTIINIFQDCTLYTGVCVQRALPEVLTIASQVIAASAANNLEINQTAGSDSNQEAIADLLAEVNVDAQQTVDANTFLRLTQICAIDIGMCIQRALPIIQTAVEQVIDANADNVTDIFQDAGEGSSQDATVLTDAGSHVTSDVDVNTQNTIEMLQRCGVKQGLCLHVDGNGNPTYIFNDGDEHVTGTYAGLLDETPLQDDYSRGSVKKVAGGICGGADTCSMVERLLFWLFGAEPVAIQETASASDNDEGTDGSASRRGHGTNVLGATVEFLAAHMDDEDELAPAAFGGGTTDAVLSDAERALACSMRKNLLKEERDDSTWDWTGKQLALQIGISVKAASALLRDPSVCPQEVAKAAPLKPSITYFPISEDGPVSNNALWNACIRGATISLDDVKHNPDRTEDGLPKTCASYHTGDSWFHPELGIYFTWNRYTGNLNLPVGYIPQVAGI